MRPPCEELEEIKLNYRNLDLNELELVHTFAPNLRRLNLAKCHPSNFIHFKEFHSLEHIGISPQTKVVSSDYESLLIDGLITSTQLTSIEFSGWIPSAPDSWLQLSRHLLHLTRLKFSRINEFPSLNVLTTFDSVKSITFKLLSSDDVKVRWMVIRDFFESPLIMPHLQQISISHSDESETFEWMVHQPRSDHYRSINHHHQTTELDHQESPLAAPLIGIEPNPGPFEEDIEFLAPARCHQIHVATLFADGLHIVYSYLTDREFFQVIHVNRHWSHCCSTGPSRQMEYYSLWCKNASSHIRRDSGLNYQFTRFESLGYENQRHYLRQLTSVIRLLPHLTQMSLNIQKNTLDLNLMEWPWRLVSLTCYFADIDYPQVFCAICQLSSLTSLTLAVGPTCLGFNPSDSFRPLTQLTSLQIWQTNRETDPLQLSTAPLIWLPLTLTQLRIDSDHFIHALPRAQNVRQIRELFLDSYRLQPNDLQLIHSHMPELELLDGVKLFFTGFPDISLLTRLESLHIQPLPDPLNLLSSTHQFIDGLGQLPRITHLQLETPDFPTDEHWMHLHRALVHLTSLKLNSMRAKLRPFKHIGLFFDRLERFTLTCKDITCDDLMMINTCHRLEYLSLTNFLSREAGSTPEVSLNHLKDFFQSTAFLPDLLQLRLTCMIMHPFSHSEFVWDQLTSTNIWTYRLGSRDHISCQTSIIPPAKPLVGIESNPGPSCASTPTAQTLFVDGLLSIFSWLSLLDVVSAYRSCHYWKRCVLKERSRHLEANLSKPTQYLSGCLSENFSCIDRSNMIDLPGIFYSPFAYHLTSLLHVTFDQLVSICDLKYDQIKKLDVKFLSQNSNVKYAASSSSSSESLPSTCTSLSVMTLPKSLTSLRITIYSSRTTDSIQTLINSITPSGSPITQLTFNNLSTHLFDLSPLTQVATLSYLHFRVVVGYTSYVTTLCQLHSLTHLKVAARVFKDTQLSQVLTALTHLDRLELTERIHSRYRQAWLHLPPHTIIHDLSMDELRSLMIHLPQTKRCATVTIDRLRTLCILTHTLGESIRILCQEHIATMSQQRRFKLEILSVNSEPFDFIYHHPSAPDSTRSGKQEIENEANSISTATVVTYVPPEPLLVGIEQNPGPLGSDARALTTQHTISIATPQLLFKDGLHIIYSYLSTMDWLNGMKTCHHWYDSVRTEPSRHLTTYYDRPSHSCAATTVHSVGESGLSLAGATTSSSSSSTHTPGEIASTTSIHLRRHYTQLRPRMPDNQTSLLPSKLFQIIKDFPDLTTIDGCTLSMDASHLDDCRWPNGLLTLSKLTLRQTEFPNLFTSLSQQLSHQLVTLSLTLEWQQQQLNLSWLSCIQDFTALTNLVIVHDMDAIDSIDFIEEVPFKRLPHSLTHLNLQHGFMNALDSIQTIPSLVNLTSLDTGMRILRRGDLERFHTVAPNITTLCFPRYAFNRVEDFAPITLFQSLHSLIINKSLSARMIESPIIHFTILSQCPSLTKLYFSGNALDHQFTCDQWLQLSTTMSNLRWLEFASLSSNSDTELCQALVTPNSFGQLERFIVRHGFSQKLFDLLIRPEICPRLTYFSMAQHGQRFEFDAINGVNVDQYRLLSTTSISVKDANATPPHPRLVGVELNPGPPSIFIDTRVSQVSSQSLFNDAMHLIYSYLNLSDFFSSIRVCHHWYECGLSAPSQQFRFTIERKDFLTRDLPSTTRFLHHFTRCSNMNSITLAQLWSTLQCLPSVTDIICNIIGPQPDPAVEPDHEHETRLKSITTTAAAEMTASWPMNLISLTIRIFPEPDQRYANLIRGISTCSSLRHLSIDGLALNEDWSLLEPYQYLNQLETFELCPYRPWDPNLGTIDLLAAMRWTQLPSPRTLRSFNLCKGDPRFLVLSTLAKLHLVDQLESLNIDDREVDADDFNYLAQFFPTLTDLRLVHPHPSFYPQLEQFHSLGSLMLGTPILPDSMTSVSLEEYESLVINGLASSTQLTKLSLLGWIPQLPTSWSTLSSALVNLRELQISDGTVASLDVLIPFTSLTSLHFSWITTELGERLRSFLSASTIMPQLRRIQVSIRDNPLRPPSFRWTVDQPEDSENVDDNFRQTTTNLAPTIIQQPSAPS